MKYWLMLFLCIYPSLSFADTELPVLISSDQDTITINTKFQGANILAFGSKHLPGQLVVVLRGPEQNIIMRQKGRAYGIWLNRKSEKIFHIPSALYIGTPEENHDSVSVLEDNGLLPKELARKSPFTKAYLLLRQDEGLYGAAVTDVEVKDGTLFSVNFPLPKKLPRGAYTLEAYLLDGSDIIGGSTIAIDVHKTGIDAFIYESASEHPALYGIAAILMALLMGGGVSLIHRR